MLWFTLAFLSLKFLVVLACPLSCACSQKARYINCANGGFTRLPQELNGNGGYDILILTNNEITGITRRDLMMLRGFKEVDLRSNPINCTANIGIFNSSVILSDCKMYMETTKPTKYQGQTSPHTTTPPGSEPQRSKFQSTTLALTRHHSGTNLLWLITILPVVTLFGLCVFIIRCKLQRSHRTIHHTPMEFYTLRQSLEDDEDEVTVFQMKEKQV